jgi:hypothetical protein
MTDQKPSAGLDSVHSILDRCRPTCSLIEERRSIGDSGHASAQRMCCEPHAHGLEYQKSISAWFNDQIDFAMFSTGSDIAAPTCQKAREAVSDLVAIFGAKF